MQQHKYPFKYLKTIQTAPIRYVTVWKEFIAATSGTFIYLWGLDGNLVAVSPSMEDVVNLIPWGDVLVSGVSGSLKYWKLKRSQEDNQTKIQFELLKTVALPSFTKVHASVLWDDKLYTVGETKNPVIKSYNKKGGHIQSYHELHGDIIEDMLVHRGLLWTASADTTVCAWRRKRFGYKLKCMVRLTLHTRAVTKLASWGNRIASASLDNTVRVWDALGRCVFVLETLLKPVALATWTEGRLVCATTSTEDTEMKHLIIWNQDGTVFHKIETLEKNQALLAIDNKLYQSTLTGVQVWETRNWKVERVLWIGWKKNNPSECSLARLPRNVIFSILTYVFAAS